MGRAWPWSLGPSPELAWAWSQAGSGPGPRPRAGMQPWAQIQAPGPGLAHVSALLAIHVCAYSTLIYTLFHSERQLIIPNKVPERMHLTWPLHSQSLPSHSQSARIHLQSGPMHSKSGYLFGRQVTNLLDMDIWHGNICW